MSTALATHQIEVLVKVVLERHSGWRQGVEALPVGLDEHRVRVHRVQLHALHEVVGELGVDEVEEDEEPVVGDGAVLCKGGKGEGG